MENRKKLNPDPVTFSIFGEKLRIFFDEDCIRIMGTDAAEILGFANGRNAVARYCPDRIMHPMKTDKGQLIQASAITEEDMGKAPCPCSCRQHHSQFSPSASAP